MIYGILILAIIGLIVYLIINNKKTNTNIQVNIPTTAVNDNIDNNEDLQEIKSENIFLPYVRKNLMTKNEWYFYKQLKPVADKLNYSILCKVRVADLVDIEKGLDKSQWQTAFNRINKKHIDFVLCKPENLYPELLIELDDSTHKSDKVAKRDEFIERLYEKTGYKLLRVQGGENIEDKIRTVLDISKDRKPEQKLSLMYKT